MSEHPSPVRTRLLLLFCVIVWGWTFVATKICLQYLSPVELLGLRFLIGLPALGIVMGMSGVRFAFEPRDLRQLIPGSAILAMHFLVQAYALTTATATNTGWIIAVTPLAMGILSFIVLKERLRPAEIAGIIVATCGILLLVSNGSLQDVGWLRSTGDWLVLLSAHTWAMYTILTRDLSRTRNPLSVTFAVFTPITIGCLVSMLVASDLRTLLSLPGEAVAALLFLGILGMVTQWFWQIGVARLGAGKAGVYLYLEPMATTVLAVPLLGEPFTLFTAIGGALVLAGVWWSERGLRQTGKP